MHILQSHNNNILAIFALLCFAKKSSELLYIIEIFIGLNLLPINIVLARKGLNDFLCYSLQPFKALS